MMLARKLGLMFVLALGCALLAGCTSSPTAPNLTTPWSLRVDGSSSIIGIDSQRLYILESRPFGNEIVAVNLKDGSFVWNQVGSPSASATLIQDKVISTQTLSKGTLVTAFDSASGKRTWQRSFLQAPLASLPDGKFLVNEDGQLAISDLAGIHTSFRWSAPKGCTTTYAAADPVDGAYYVAATCDGANGSRLFVLNPDLKQQSTQLFEGTNGDFGAPLSRGDYTIFPTTASVAVYAAGALVYSGGGVSTDQFAVVGSSLRLVPTTGSPFLIQKGIGVVEPTSKSAFEVVVSDGGFGYAREDFLNARSGHLEGSVLVPGYISQTAQLADGSGQIEVESTTNTSVVRQVTYGQAPASPKEQPIAITSSRLEGPTGQINLEVTSWVHSGGTADEVELQFFGESLAEPTGVVKVLQLDSARSSTRTLHTLQAANRDPSGIQYVASGRCIASAETAGTSDARVLGAIVESLFASVVTKGCHG